ncbi:hypothetical protein BKA69DRAFT_926515 [Paraphysoderma sedebokerense]|nr:hypothetical protein BKA69DRAFT_926515 [Paraphysoderma sedebokerense]
MTMAGWGNVATAAVCVNETTPCPDVMVLGTTQLPGRVSEGLAEPLDSYFLDWSREKGQQITDDIVKYAFYDYFIDNAWAAMPLMSDYRILYFNRTVFDQLNLTYPPPLGNWGEPFWKGWTWEVFTDYAIRIKNHLNTTGSGFRLPSAWEEEFYFIQNIFRNYGVGFLDPSTKKCGLRNAEAVVAVKDIVQKLFIDEKAADLEGFFPNDAKFQNWTNAGLLDPLKNDLICCTVRNFHTYDVDEYCHSIE